MEHTHLDEPKLQALPTGDHDDTHKEKEHDHFLGNFINWAGAGTIGFSLAPLVLQQIGIGREQAALSDTPVCCALIQDQAKKLSFLEINNLYKPLGDVESTPVNGIAGALSAAFSHIPFGEKMLELEQKIHEKIPFIASKDLDPTVHPLSRGGVINMAVAAALITGAYGFNYLEKIEKNYFVEQAKKQGASDAELDEIAENAGGFSRFAKIATQAAGFTVLMPAILPGIGHSLLSLSATLGLDRIDYKAQTSEGPFSTLAAILGKNPGLCKGNDKLTDTAGAVLTTQLCCVGPALWSSVPMLFSHTNTPENKLPEGINPYRKQDHDLMPNIEKLAQLTDAEIEQRIKDNAYHIEDTEAAQQRTATVRNAAKFGAGAAAAVVTAVVARHVINMSDQKTKEQAKNIIEKIDAVPQNSANYGQWHKIDGMHAQNGLSYGVVRFSGPKEAEIQKNITENIGEKVPLDFLQFRIAPCGINPDAMSGSVCQPLTSSPCCVATFINGDLVNELKNFVGKLMGSETIPQNQALLSGVASAAAGAGIYKLVGNFLDKANNNIIHPLKHENFVLESILAGRKKSTLEGENNIIKFDSAVHEGKIAEQPLAVAANIK